MKYLQQNMKWFSCNWIHWIRISTNSDWYSLRKKCPYSEFFWSVFSRIQSECGKVRTRITPNTDTFHAVTKENKVYQDENYPAKSVNDRGSRFSSDLNFCDVTFVATWALTYITFLIRIFFSMIKVLAYHKHVFFL